MITSNRINRFNPHDDVPPNELKATAHSHVGKGARTGTPNIDGTALLNPKR